MINTLLFLMPVVLITGMLLPSWKRYRVLTSELTELGKTLNNAASVLVESQLVTEEAQLPFLDEISLIRYLETLAHRHMVGISELSLTEQHHQYGFTGYSIFLSLGGDFTSLTEFIESLEISSHPLQVIRWSYNKDPLSQMLSLRLNLILWGEGDRDDGNESQKQDIVRRSNPFVLP